MEKRNSLKLLGKKKKTKKENSRKIKLNQEN